MELRGQTEESIRSSLFEVVTMRIEYLIRQRIIDGAGLCENNSRQG